MMNESMQEHMGLLDERETAAVDGCPVKGKSSERPQLSEDTNLLFLQHRRLYVEYSTAESGERELHLYYGEKEIAFDDPELFAFGEGLAKHERFLARDTTTWGTGYEWARVRELLEELISEGFLTPMDPHESGIGPRPQGACPSPLPPAKSMAPRTWFDSEAILRELTGHPLEVGYLEAVIPVSHVAHMAMDTEGRQMGEANVFPPQLRLEIPTEWRTCPHAGTRYLNEKPMNATALKSMRHHWPQIMAVLVHIREAFIQRFPHVRQGWTVGDLQRLATVVLAIPGYLLMRTHDRIENGQLHPVLSGMVRVTDGIRMTTTEMLYTSESYEPNRLPDALLTGTDIYAYAERNYLLHSMHGVCAGPKAMIDEFLAVLVDGHSPKSGEDVVLEPALLAMLSELDEAFDYGLYGLQSYAIVYSLWPAMRQSYEKLINLVTAWPGERSDVLNTFADRLQESAQYLEGLTRMTVAQYSAVLGRVYEDMYEQATNALGCLSSGKTYAESMTPTNTPHHADATAQLQALLYQHLNPITDADCIAVNSIVDCLMDYSCQEQAVVRAVGESQRAINRLLERAMPTRPLAAADLHLFQKLRGGSQRQPYLPDDIADMLEIRITVTQDDIHIVDRSMNEPTVEQSETRPGGQQ
ncbi:MAG: hypothetical protein JSR31_07910 [Nitrospira sp.]|nr:hypothetical protein [Nitrospira sp.]